MRYSRASMARRVAVVLAAASTTACTMVRELDLSGPVLPGTLVVILALLAGMFAVAWSRYAHGADASESRADSRSDNVA